MMMMMMILCWMMTAMTDDVEESILVLAVSLWLFWGVSHKCYKNQ